MKKKILAALVMLLAIVPAVVVKAAASYSALDYINFLGTEADKSAYEAGDYSVGFGTFYMGTSEYKDADNHAYLKVVSGGTAGTTDVTRTINMEATQNIVLTFDNSNIVTKEEDPNGKNKQLIVTITLNYEKTTAVNGIAEVAAQASEVLKVLANGKFVILKAGKEYNAAGQLVR